MKTIPSIDKRLDHAFSLSRKLLESRSKWFEENPLKITCEKFDNDLGVRLILNSFPEQNLLDEWGLICGDCIHNLRCALDNLIYELACIKCIPPIEPLILSFPIKKKREQFVGTIHKCLEQLPERAASLIELIQPFQRDGSPGNGTPDSDILALLNEMDNIDKHRIPSLVLLIPLSQEHSISYSLLENEFALPEILYIRQEPLEKDCILAEYKFPHRIHGEGKLNMEANLSIILNDKPFEIEEILNLLILYTNQIINLFRDFFPNNPDIAHDNLINISVMKNDKGFQFKQIGSVSP